MKMKWKIVLILNFLLVIIIVITDIFFHKTVTSLLENEINEELENYSVLGTSLLDAVPLVIGVSMGKAFTKATY